MLHKLIRVEGADARFRVFLDGQELGGIPLHSDVTVDVNTDVPTVKVTLMAERVEVVNSLHENEEKT